jgi:hypothetical protein
VSVVVSDRGSQTDARIAGVLSPRVKPRPDTVRLETVGLAKRELRNKVPVEELESRQAKAGYIAA